MPEAEQVLIEAAAHATTWVRKLWTRYHAPGSTECDVRRRLGLWQMAWLGRAWPIVAADPAPAPGLVSRWLRRPPPWRAHPPATSTTDGHRIFVPRGWLVSPSDDPLDSQRGLFAALCMACRLARDSAVCASNIPQSHMQRDLVWLLEGALADTALARDFPGLASSLERVRLLETRRRPPACKLRPIERQVEMLACSLLSRPPAMPPRLCDELLDPEMPVQALVERAAAWVATQGETPDYRGVAPVTHWGELGPRMRPATSDLAADLPTRTRRSSARRPAASLPRPMRPAPELTRFDRAGPFVVPFQDAHTTASRPGVVRPADASSAEDPETLASEIARLGSLPRVRRPGEVHEVIEGGRAPDRPKKATKTGNPTATTWLYPEWDLALGRYRERACRVCEAPPMRVDPELAEQLMEKHGPLHRQLRRQLQTLRPRRAWLRDQGEGDDIDLRAWVMDWADQQAGYASEGRIYTQERRVRRDVAVCLLLDVSGSTESWIGGRQRIIDVVKESALAFGEALSAVGDHHAILAFSGQGAAAVRVIRLKCFSESPGAAIRARISGLEPDAFTRLGGALRHTTAELAQQPARTRLLVLVSDGKPQDEDAYNGIYGIEDARMAVTEARLAGVRVFALTVDREAPEDLPRMFGPNGYLLLNDVRALPQHLPSIYRRLTAGA